MIKANKILNLCTVQEINVFILQDHSFLSRSLSLKMDRSLLILSFMALCLGFSSAQERSPKKGMVIPSWPRHLVGDFDNMDTIR